MSLIWSSSQVRRRPSWALDQKPPNPPPHLFAWGGTRPHGGSTPCAWAEAGTRTDGCTCSCSCRWWWCSSASPPGTRGGESAKRCAWNKARKRVSELEGWGGGDRCEKREERGASAEMLIKEVRGLWCGGMKRGKKAEVGEGKSLEGWWGEQRGQLYSL